jgi:hypothetical protein
MLMRNPSSVTRTRRLARSATIAGLAAAVIGVTTAVAAEPTPTIDLTGTGSSRVAGDGSVIVRGTATGRPGDSPYTGTVTANDGTMSDPGACEPATATLRLIGPNARFVELTTYGDLCRRWTDATTPVTYVFTGRFDLTTSFHHAVAATATIRLADDGTSAVHVTDS